MTSCMQVLTTAPDLPLSVQGASYYVLPTSDGSLVCFTLAPGTAPAACAALY